MPFAAWRALSPSVQRLWLGAGGLFVAGNVFKYIVWSQARDEIVAETAKTNESAARQLAEARASAQKYALPPLEKK